MFRFCGFIKKNLLSASDNFLNLLIPIFGPIMLFFLFLTWDYFFSSIKVPPDIWKKGCQLSCRQDGYQVYIVHNSANTLQEVEKLLSLMEINKRLIDDCLNTNIRFSYIDHMNSSFDELPANTSYSPLKRLVIIVLNTFDVNEGQLNYTLRTMDYGNNYVWKYPGDHFNSDAYYDFPLFSILIDYSFMSMVSKSTLLIPKFRFHYLPHNQIYEPKKFSEISLTIETYQGDKIYYYLILSNTLFPIFIVITLTVQKLDKSRIFIQSFGLDNYLFYYHHLMIFVTFSIVHTLSWSLMMLSLVNLSAPLSKTDPLLLIMVLFCYSIAIILWSFLGSVFVTTQTSAIIFTLCCWALIAFWDSILYGPFSYRDSLNRSSAYKYLECLLLPPVALRWAWRMIYLMDNDYDGANFSRWNKLINSISLQEVVHVIILSWLFHCILIWIFEPAWPWQTRRSRLRFIFNYRYWTSFKTPKSIIEQSGKGCNRTQPLVGKHLDIIFHNVSFGYFWAKKPYLSNINLAIPINSTTMIIGPTGSGKSTTLHLMAGYLTPKQGEIYVDGFLVYSRLFTYRRRTIFCPQFDYLKELMTVADYINFVLRIRKHPQLPDGEVETIMHYLHLKSFLPYKIKFLSLEARRLIQIGLVLLSGHPIVLLDEPTNVLSSFDAIRFWTLIGKLRRTYVITTTALDDLENYGQRGILLSNGKVQAQGELNFLRKAFSSGQTLTISVNKNFKQKKFTQFCQSLSMEAIPLGTTLDKQFVYRFEKDDEKSINLLSENIKKDQPMLRIEKFSFHKMNLDKILEQIVEQNGVYDQIDSNGLLDSPSLSMARKVITIRIKLFCQYFFRIISFNIIIGGIFTLITVSQSQWSDEVFFWLKLYTESNLVSLRANEIYNHPMKALVLVDQVNSQNELIVRKYSESVQKSQGISVDITNNSGHDSFSRYAIGIDVNRFDDKRLTLYFNPESADSLPIAINAYNNYFFTKLIEKSSPRLQPLIRANNYRLRSTNMEKLWADFVFYRRMSLFWFLSIALSMMATFYVIQYSLFNEKPFSEQFPRPRSPSFWIANYAFDLVHHTIFVIIVALLVWCNDKSDLNQEPKFLAVFAILCGYGIGIIPVAMLISVFAQNLKNTRDTSLIYFLITCLKDDVIFLYLSRFNSFPEVQYFYETFLLHLATPATALFALRKIFIDASLKEYCRGVISLKVPDFCSILMPKQIMKEYCCSLSKRQIYSFSFTISRSILGEILLMVATGNIILSVVMLCEYKREKILDCWKKINLRLERVKLSWNKNEITL